jgi:RND superfamily putative drug exporter
VLRGLVATGPVITSAGLILAGTFVVLASLPVWLLLQLGFVVALGVLLDTFLVRTIIVPAITVVLGERAWWPGSSRPSRPGSIPGVAAEEPAPSLAPRS